MPTTANGFRPNDASRDGITQAPVKHDGTMNPDLAGDTAAESEAESVKQFFKETGESIDQVLSTIDRFYLDEALHNHERTNISPPPYTPFLTKVFDLRQYWMRPNWKMLQVLIQKTESEFVAPTPPSGKEWKVDMKSDPMVIEVGKEMVKTLGDKLKTEWDTIYIWLEPWLGENEELSCLVNDSKERVMMCLAILEENITGKRDDAVSVQSSGRESDVDEHGDTTLTGTGGSLSGTQGTQLTAPAMSHGQASKWSDFTEKLRDGSCVLM